MNGVGSIVALLVGLGVLTEVHVRLGHIRKGLQWLAKTRRRALIGVVGLVVGGIAVGLAIHIVLRKPVEERVKDLLAGMAAHTRNPARGNTSAWRNLIRLNPRDGYYEDSFEELVGLGTGAVDRLIVALDDTDPCIRRTTLVQNKAKSQGL